MHLSGGVGIGGVLEPLQANPTIIEDNCFIGARSEIVEGVIVEENSVISMGVYISQSTKIYDRDTGEISYGRVPAGSVVVSGNLPSARRQIQSVLRGDRQEGRRRHPRQDGINELLRPERRTALPSMASEPRAYAGPAWPSRRLATLGRGSGAHKLRPLFIRLAVFQSPMSRFILAAPTSGTQEHDRCRWSACSI